MLHSRQVVAPLIPDFVAACDVHQMLALAKVLVPYLECYHEEFEILLQVTSPVPRPVLPRAGIDGPVVVGIPHLSDTAQREVPSSILGIGAKSAEPTRPHRVPMRSVLTRHQSRHAGGRGLAAHPAAPP